jgi:hypothetical protein
LHVPAVLTVIVAVVVSPLSDVLPLAIVQTLVESEVKVDSSPELDVAVSPTAVFTTCVPLGAVKSIACDNGVTVKLIVKGVAAA